MFDLIQSFGLSSSLQSLWLCFQKVGGKVQWKGTYLCTKSFEIFTYERSLESSQKCVLWKRVNGLKNFYTQTSHILVSFSPEVLEVPSNIKKTTGPHAPLKGTQRRPDTVGPDENHPPGRAWAGRSAFPNPAAWKTSSAVHCHCLLTRGWSPDRLRAVCVLAHGLGSPHLSTSPLGTGEGPAARWKPYWA